MMERRSSQHGGTPLPGTLHASVADWAPRQLVEVERWSPEPLSLSRMGTPALELPADYMMGGGSSSGGEMDTDMSDAPPSSSSPKSARGSPQLPHGNGRQPPSPRGGAEAPYMPDDQVELVYDKQLNCYFNPVTHRYYRLV